jgi:hypothetical protein
MLGTKTLHMLTVDKLKKAFIGKTFYTCENGRPLCGDTQKKKLHKAACVAREALTISLFFPL